MLRAILQCVQLAQPGRFRARPPITHAPRPPQLRAINRVVCRHVAKAEPAQSLILVHYQLV